MKQLEADCGFGGAKIMNKLFLTILVLLIFSGISFSQKESSDLKISELYSTYLNAENPPNLSDEKAQKNCFDFIKETEVECKKRWDLVYGNLRTGDDWNWFEVSSNQNVRSKIVNLGKFNWADSFEVPLIEPYPKLKAGESRAVMADTSSKNGRNGNSKIADESKKDIEKSEVKNRSDFTKAILGNMYAVRIVDDNVDFYVLLRIDALEGDKCTISWKKVDAPKEK